MKLHENIRELRKKRNMTQEQLAEVMGVSTASVSKWETAQSAPELLVLLDLADYFAVSVDMLMGHTVEADRVESRLAEMEALSKAGEYNRCTAAAEKLLRNYPNDAQVLNRCSEMYYYLYMSTNERDHMERSIELMRRLMAVESDPSGMKRFEWLSRLANRYEFLEKWDLAEEYYKQGNVAGMNARELARCYAAAGKDQQALETLSDAFVHALFEMVTDITTISNLLQQQGKLAEAEAALNWGCRALEEAGSTVSDKYAGLSAVLYVMWSAILEEKGDTAGADDRIRNAVQSLCRTERKTDFLCPKKLSDLVGNIPDNGQKLLQILSKLGADRLRAVAEEALE